MAPVEAWGRGTPLVTFGYGSDLHWADKATSINRHFRDADEKLAAAVAVWNRAGVDFVIMNGDFVDGAGLSKSTAEADLAAAEAVYDDLTVDRYYAFGNHDLDKLTKAEFIAATGMTDAYYSFDVGTKLHVVVLDSCYDADDDGASYAAGGFDFEDTYINPAQRTWLTSDLAGTALPVIVFLHNPLHPNALDSYRVDNASTVRGILESDGNVLAVFNGHAHVNAREKLNGIRYFSMDAMTESAFPANPFAIVRIYEQDDWISVRGYGDQDSYAGMLPLW